MPSIQPETQDTSPIFDTRPWLTALHGIDLNRSVTLDLAKFTDPNLLIDDGTDTPRIKSGTPLTRQEDGTYAPYTAADGQVFSGLLFTADKKVASGKTGAAMFIHGLVDPTKVPGTFTAPAAQPVTDILFR